MRNKFSLFFGLLSLIVLFSAFFAPVAMESRDVGDPPCFAAEHTGDQLAPAVLYQINSNQDFSPLVQAEANDDSPVQFRDCRSFWPPGLLRGDKYTTSYAIPAGKNVQIRHDRLFGIDIDRSWAYWQNLYKRSNPAYTASFEHLTPSFYLRC